MSVMVSRACEYALQAMLFLAAQPPNRPVLQRDISDKLNIPPHFLGKVLQNLARNRLVISQKGKSGGFILGKPAKEITPYEIIEAVEGPTFLEGCLMGFPGCTDEHPCPLHEKWKELRFEIMQMLQEKNIARLSEELGPKLESIRQLYAVSVQ